eukprot:gnl/TRDRNA2_/TRDRNA2_149071_c0_seq1.p1 gnl/TRDRNA2_/TRDRNA2_149071_c0~~gnl/TRDRNA2_/TRDRNA2_149071_c0_seq1.p1  ORF type:complete len:261 (-),score=32.90 gnl/TRDRNA2_/TRDRNA2_149071_c0_seq1:760-1542(-)
MAKRHGPLAVTLECYSYGAGMTRIDSGVFSGDWRTKLACDWSDIEFTETGERVRDAAHFAELQKRGGLVACHVVPEWVVRLGIAHPAVAIASDSIPFRRDAYGKPGRAHPRAAGCFTRILGRYVRDEKLLPLALAVKKMTLLPAQRLLAAVPSIRKKGRVQAGCDADLVVFDASSIADHATFADPAIRSVGMRHVLVNGTPIVCEGDVPSAIREALDAAHAAQASRDGQALLPPGAERAPEASVLPGRPVRGVVENHTLA